MKMGSCPKVRVLEIGEELKKSENPKQKVKVYRSGFSKRIFCDEINFFQKRIKKRAVKIKFREKNKRLACVIFNSVKGKNNRTIEGVTSSKFLSGSKGNALW